MNTEPEQKEQPKNRPLLADLASDFDDHSKALQALADAQEEIGEIRDARREERIGWIVVTVILFDCLFLLNAENWSGPIVIGILEIGILAVAAKRLGVEEFYALFVGVMNRFGGMALGDKEN
tara:strand:+ start:2681 stop:3046 length:366 start_codon:yes stop_codon:yes gene_type:complete